MKENNDKEIEYDESDLVKILRQKELLKEKNNQFTPFLKRKDVDWTDIIPLEQFSPEIDILKMEYDDKFIEISSYFRAILHKNEISYRAFNLTTELIQVNSTNYMAWYHRRQCIDLLKVDLKKELDWLDEIGVINQKNYQIWHHRKVVIEKLNDPSHEKAFLDRVFDEEPKNFHAWCHRIWVVRRFNLFEGEINYIENMLKSVSLS
jgi:protein farnesyltransferase/geranylgeranyltransferase type-1 subunit alpha